MQCALYRHGRLDGHASTVSRHAFQYAARACAQRCRGQVHAMHVKKAREQGNLAVLTSPAWKAMSLQKRPA